MWTAVAIVLHFELKNKSKVTNIQLVDNTNQSARGGASIAIGDGNLSMRENLVMTSAYDQPTTRLIRTDWQEGTK